MSEQAALIAELNDRLRRSLGTGTPLGTVVVTAGFMTLEMPERNAVVQAVIDFNRFTKENDPFGEHDFGAITLPGIDKVFWKIDLHEERPVKMFDEGTYAEPVYTRVLTIMLTEEY